MLGNADISGKAAVFLVPQHRWQEVDVQGGKAALPTLSQLGRDTVVYYRAAQGRPVFKVVWRFATKPAVAAPAVKAFGEVCAQKWRDERRSDNGATWEI